MSTRNPRDAEEKELLDYLKSRGNPDVHFTSGSRDVKETLDRITGEDHPQEVVDSLLRHGGVVTKTKKWWQFWRT